MNPLERCDTSITEQTTTTTTTTRAMSVRTTASAFEPLADIRLRKRIDYPAGHSQEEQASGDRCELIDDMILGSERVISRTVEQTEDWNLRTLGPPRGCEQRTVLRAVVPMYRNPYLPPLSRMTNGDVLLRASCRSCQNDKERSGLLCRNTSPHTQQSNKETYSGVRRERERAMVLVLGRQTHDDRLHTVRNDTTTVSVEHPEKKDAEMWARHIGAVFQIDQTGCHSSLPFIRSSFSSRRARLLD